MWVWNVSFLHCFQLQVNFVLVYPIVVAHVVRGGGAAPPPVIRQSTTHCKNAMITSTFKYYNTCSPDFYFPSRRLRLLYGFCILCCQNIEITYSL